MNTFTKFFSHGEIEKIHQFVIKKLQVKDLFKVRDRFEGHQYLINVINKYFITQTLFEYFDISKAKEIKIGFISTINLNEAVKDKIIILNSIIELENHVINDNLIYIFSNLPSKSCTLHHLAVNKNEIKTEITNYLNNFSSHIYQNKTH